MEFSQCAGSHTLWKIFVYKAVNECIFAEASEMHVHKHGELDHIEF